MAINKKSFEPIYHQLATEIKKQISKGKLQPGDPIPSESALIKKYQISRGTVRQAMQILENETLIEKFPGRGTFVAEPPQEETPVVEPVASEAIKKQITVKSMFEQVIESTSKPTSINMVEKSQSIATPKIQNLLKLANDSVITSLNRILFVNDEPWCVEKSYFPEEIGKVIENFDLTKTLYTQFQSQTSNKIILTKYIIESMPADDEFSLILKVEKGTPLFQLIRVSYFDNNRPFELSYDTYRADRLRFNLAMSYESEDMKFNVKPLKQFR